MIKPIQLFLHVDVATRDGRRMLLERALGNRWAHVVAKRTGFRPSYISHIVAGRRRNKDVEALLAQIAGFPVHDMFPGHEGL